MQAPATPNDQRHLAVLRKHWKAHRSLSNLAKLGNLLGLSSTGSVFEFVDRLATAGYLARKDGRVASSKRFYAYPMLVVPQVSPRRPKREEQIAFTSMDNLLVREPNDTPRCRVRDDSMRDAGLLDGASWSFRRRR